MQISCTFKCYFDKNVLLSITEPRSQTAFKCLMCCLVNSNMEILPRFSKFKLVTGGLPVPPSGATPGLNSMPKAIQVAGPIMSPDLSAREAQGSVNAQPTHS